MSTLQDLDNTLNNLVTQVDVINGTIGSLQQYVIDAVALLETPPTPPIDYQSQVDKTNMVIASLTTINNQLGQMQLDIAGALPH